MPERISLPVDDMSKRDFEKFRGAYLDKGELTEEALEEISKLFGLGKAPHLAVRVCCNDYHAHSFRCLEFARTDSGIVERLVAEVRKYQGKLREIANLVGYDQKISPRR